MSKTKVKQVKAAEEPKATKGLECPKCGCKHLPVVYTIRMLKGITRRRRECRYCGHRITSHEQVGAIPAE